MVNKNTISLIDADSLVYSSSKETIEESISIIDEKILNILKETNCEYFCLFISKGKYFRHEISKQTYKQNRGKYGTPLLWLKTLKSYIQDKYKANSMNLVEADDLISYWYWKTEFKPILCAIDKDLINSIPGRHFNYTYKLGEKDNPDSLIKGSWIDVSIEDCKQFQLYQLIYGDSTDCVSGLKGNGPAFFKSIQSNLKHVSDILYYYIALYGDSEGIYQFQLNYRLLTLLSTDEDYIREIGELPQLPNILKSEDYLPTTENTTTGLIIDGLF